MTWTRGLLFGLLPGAMACALAACGDEAVTQPPADHPFSSEKAGGRGFESEAQVIGEFIGTWDAQRKTLSFEPKPDTRAGGLKPEGFAVVDGNRMTFQTLWSKNGPSDAPTPCPAAHLCANVYVKNTTSRLLGTVWVEVYGTNPPQYAPDNPDSIPTGYWVDPSQGAWFYGSTMAVGKGGQRIWNFNNPDESQNFTFNARVKATFFRTAYSSEQGTLSEAQNTHGAAWSDTAPVWVDACQLPGATTVLPNALPGAYASFTLPFPYTPYNKTWSLDANAARINAVGALGFMTLRAANLALPTVYAQYSLIPFWDSIATRSSGVCYAVDGAPPNRRLVVTWSNAYLYGYPNSNITFSAVVREATDEVWFLYHRWSGNSSDCSSESVPAIAASLRGGSATIGVESSSSDAYQFSYNTAFLPAHDASCPGTGYWVKLIPAPANSL